MPLNKIEVLLPLGGSLLQERLQRALVKKSLRRRLIKVDLRNRLRLVVRRQKAEQICRLAQVSRPGGGSLNHEHPFVRSLSRAVGYRCRVDFQHRRLLTFHFVESHSLPEVWPCVMFDLTTHGLKQ